MSTGCVLRPSASLCSREGAVADLGDFHRLNTARPFRHQGNQTTKSVNAVSDDWDTVQSVLTELTATDLGIELLMRALGKGEEMF